MSDALLFFFCSAQSPLSLENLKSDKPLVRGEPNDLKTHCYSVIPLCWHMDSLQSITIEYQSCTILSQIVSARIGSTFFRLEGISNCELNMVDAFLYLASVISNKYLASVSVSR